MTARRIIQKWWGLRSRWRTGYARLRYRRLHLAPGARVDGRLRISGPGTVTIGPRSRIEEATIRTFNATSTVVVGRDCYLNGPDISAGEPVRIGDRCDISNVLITSTDFHSTLNGLLAGKSGKDRCGSATMPGWRPIAPCSGASPSAIAR